MKTRLILSSLYLLVLLFCSPALLATHILGGNIGYSLLDSTTNLYEIKLTVFRDCLNGQAPFDANASFFIYEKGDTVPKIVVADLSTQNPISLTNSMGLPNGCTAIFPSVCVEVGTYISQVKLDPSPLGYDVSWARCCLLQTIENLANPSGEGLTFTAYIPPTSMGNNHSPRFEDFPPITLCGNRPFNLSFAATDPDGDSLVYSIVTPHGGLNTEGLGVGNPAQGSNTPVADPNFNPLGPPPYVPMQFAAPYDSLNPFNASRIQIDAETGILSGDSVEAGVYMYSIAVKEYRDGLFIGETRQTAIFYFVFCEANALHTQLILPDTASLVGGLPTVFVPKGTSFCYELFVTSPDSSDVIKIANRMGSPAHSMTDTVGTDSLRSTLCFSVPPGAENETCFILETEIFSRLNCPKGPIAREILQICVEEGGVNSRFSTGELSSFLSVFPNPGTSRLQINLEKGLLQKGKMEILNVAGKTYAQRPITSGQSSWDIPTETWPSGIYFIKIEAGGKQGLSLWMKQ